MSVHSFRVSGGEERHQFFLNEKIARLEEEQQRKTPTKTPKPTKRSHQRKDFDNTTDAALLSLERERERERSKNVLFWIHIYACVCFYSFEVKRQRHLFPSFLRVSLVCCRNTKKRSTEKRNKNIEFFVKNSSL